MGGRDLQRTRRAARAPNMIFGGADADEESEVLLRVEACWSLIFRSLEGWFSVALCGAVVVATQLLLRHARLEVCAGADFKSCTP